MSEVSKKSIQIVRPVLFAALLVLGLVMVAFANQSLPVRQSVAPTASPASSDTEDPSAPAAQVTVNGEAAPAESDGSAKVSSQSTTTTHVTVSDGRTTTTSSSSTSGPSTTSSNDGNVNVNVDSNSTGGNSWGTTQVFGFNATTNGSSTSFNSTNVFSTDSSHVNVSTP